ncbi:MAG: hypothetical protein KC646_01605 [Candidatus Cloacimonetes bacterium]|nr:hypothetical protein [Candidatus Cloacimonadota bacterium]
MKSLLLGEFNLTFLKNNREIESKTIIKRSKLVIVYFGVSLNINST